MRGILITILTAIIVITIGGGIYYYFFVYKSEQSVSEKTSNTIEKDQDQQSEIEGDAYSGCPTGLVCIGSKYVPTLPTVKLGASEVYAAEKKESDSGILEKQEYQESQIGPKTPQNILVTNKDFSIWSVVWVTNEPQTGYIKYGLSKDAINRKAYDDREVSVMNLEKRYTHHVTIENNASDLSEAQTEFYFVIVSGDEEFASGDESYVYKNAPLTSSPSTPTSISVTALPILNDRKDDYIVIARQKSSEEVSTSVSSAFNLSGGCELNIGISRTQDLASYFTTSSTNAIELKLYGPKGYVGYIDSMILSELEEKVLQVKVSETGYEGNIYSSSGIGGYDIYGKESTSQLSTTSTITTTTSTQRDNKETAPRTGLDGLWLFTSIFGLVIFMLGVGFGIIIFPWSYRASWEKKVLREIDLDE